MKYFATFLVLWVSVGCGRGSPPAGSPPADPPPPQAPNPAHRPPVTTPARPPATALAGCVDPLVIRAFEALRGCNYRGGVLDFQCGARRDLQRTLHAQERDSRALVQLTLLQLLGHREERVRLAAAKSLGPYAKQRSVRKRLAAAFRAEKSPPVRSWIIYSLHGGDATARALAIAALRSDAAALVRARVAQRLGAPEFARDPAVARALMRAVRKDADVTVRQRAAEALGRTPPTPAAETLLLSCLPDKALGPHCALGLGRMGTKQGFEAVFARLQADAAKARVTPVVLWGLVEFAGRPEIRAAAVRGLLVGIAKNPREAASARHFAVKGLSRLAQREAGQRGATLVALRSLQRDAVVGVSVRMALKSLSRSPKPPGEKSRKSPGDKRPDPKPGNPMAR